GVVQVRDREGGDERELIRLRDPVVHQAAGHELALTVVDQLLPEPRPDPLDRAPEELSLDDRGVDRSPAVVDDGVSEQPDLADLACGPQDGGAGVGGDAAAPGSHAEGMDLGVPRDDHHVLEADPERVGGDLSQGGRVTLALSGDSDVDEDLAARIDPDGGALVGADARALRVAGDADT